MEKAVWYIDRELSKPLLKRVASRISRWLLSRKLRGRIGFNDVTTDWKLSSNLSIAIAMMHDGRRTMLKAAKRMIEKEIEERRR